MLSTLFHPVLILKVPCMTNITAPDILKLVLHNLQTTEQWIYYQYLPVL